MDYQGFGSNTASLHDVRRDPRYRFVKGDIADYAFTRKVVKNASVIVNFAAQTHVDRSISNPELFFESNSRAVYNVVRAAQEREGVKVVQISTDEVYGSLNHGSFDENSPLRPSSPYSATKASGDLFVHAWNTTYDLGIITLRCTNNFGPWQHPEKFIPKSIIRGLKGEGLPLYGGGGQIRDWIHVNDFCRSVDLALKKGVPGEVYNISAGNELSNREVAQRIVKLIDKPSVKLIDVPDRPGHDARYSLNSQKARVSLNWKPAYTFDEALSMTVKWYQDHESWWRKIATSKVLSETPWKERW